MGTESVEKACHDRHLRFKIHISIWFPLKCLELNEVNPAYTSQSCNACGFTDPENRNDRKFECVACGHADHADLNAARNILTSGTGVSARRGALALATPVTRETDRKLAA